MRTESERVVPSRPLTEREKVALEFMIDGPTMQELADLMRVKVRTSKFYTDALRLKFGVKDRRELIRVARLWKEQQS